MILYRWQGTCTNFGDELNTLLWPALLPDFFDTDPSVRFLGIGSVLDRRHPAEPVKLVAGTGYGGYEPKPRLRDNYIIHWVRGPRTAAVLGLPGSLGLGDPAALVPATLGLTATGGPDIGFMPHFESAQRGAWQQVTQYAGIRLIDPREPPLLVSQTVAGCQLLLTEALHGAIVADALRVPWIAIRPRHRVHRAKWHDWADTVGLTLRFHGLPASSPVERVAGQFARWHLARAWLDRNAHHLQAEPMIGRAVVALQRVVMAAPQLSPDAALDRCQSRMRHALHALRHEPLRSRATSRVRSRLQHGNETAYQLETIN